MDTSALVALAKGEAGADLLKEALLPGTGLIPAPALTEFVRVMTERGRIANQAAANSMRIILEFGNDVIAYTAEDAKIASEANTAYGLGNGRGGTLNLLDLMVYAIAKRTGLPILCTGRDFLATNVDIHPASRPD